jgi:hypothetical protein
MTVSGITPSFLGTGVSKVTRSAQGVYQLTLDPGLPGNAGEVAPSIAGGPPAPNLRSLVNIRGSTSPVPGGSDISGIGVSYIDPSVADGGLQQVQLVFTANTTGLGVDPTGASASGVEVIVWSADSEAVSAPIQIIAHGLFVMDNSLFPTADGTAIVNSNGISSIERFPGGSVEGDFLITLDPGLPGCVAVPGPGSFDDAPRIIITPRAGFGLPYIDSRTVTYVPPSMFNPNAGVTQFRIVLDSVGSPSDVFAFEILVWRGNLATPQPNLQAVGPLFQPVRRQ